MYEFGVMMQGCDVVLYDVQCILMLLPKWSWVQVCAQQHICNMLQYSMCNNISCLFVCMIVHVMCFNTCACIKLHMSALSCTWVHCSVHAWVHLNTAPISWCSLTVHEHLYAYLMVGYVRHLTQEIESAILFQKYLDTGFVYLDSTYHMVHICYVRIFLVYFLQMGSWLRQLCQGSWHSVETRSCSPYTGRSHGINCMLRWVLWSNWMQLPSTGA